MLNLNDFLKENLGIYNDAEQPGGCLAYIDDNQCNFNYVGSFDNKIINPNTQFHIASLSKQFTSLALLMALDENNISLDASANSILNYNWLDKRITIKNLLTHTSGLNDFFPVLEVHDPTLEKEVTTNQIMEIIKKYSDPIFTPGTRFMYSNSGYVLLAKIIEKITTSSYEEYLENKIFAPLKMNDTIVNTNPKENKLKIRCYYKPKFSLQGEKFIDCTPHMFIQGSTAIITTPNDYAKWIQAQLSNEKYKKYLRKANTPFNKNIRFGLGYEISTIKNKEVLSHSGNDLGFNNYFVMCPSEKKAVFCFTNIYIELAGFCRDTLSSRIRSKQNNNIKSIIDVPISNLISFGKDENMRVFDKEFTSQYYPRELQMRKIKENTYEFEDNNNYEILINNKTNIIIKDNIQRIKLIKNNNVKDIKLHDGEYFSDKENKSITIYKYNDKYILQLENREYHIFKINDSNYIASSWCITVLNDSKIKLSKSRFSGIIFTLKK